MVEGKDMPEGKQRDAVGRVRIENMVTERRYTAGDGGLSEMCEDSQGRP